MYTLQHIPLWPPSSPALPTACSPVFLGSWCSLGFLSLPGPFCSSPGLHLVFPSKRQDVLLFKCYLSSKSNRAERIGVARKSRAGQCFPCLDGPLSWRLCMPSLCPAGCWKQGFSFHGHLVFINLSFLIITWAWWDASEVFCQDGRRGVALPVKLQALYLVAKQARNVSIQDSGLCPRHCSIP